MTPKKRFHDVCIAFVAELSRIDKAVPWSETEPEWWLDMADLKRKVREVIKKNESQEDAAKPSNANTKN